MSVGKNAPQWHLPGYSGHVPRYAESFGVTYARATSAVLEPVRNPSPCVYQWQEGSGTAATTRSVTQSPGFLPGPGYNGVLHTVAGQPQVTVTQGSKTNLKAYYDSLAREEAAAHAKAAALGVPVQEKKKTRNNSNVSMGDQFYWTGKHMFQTSFQEAFPDIAKANKQAAGPGPRVNYTAVEKDAAKEIANMIQFKSHGQFADMQKAFLEYDKDRSGTLDREELAQICHRFHLGNGDEAVIQALIDVVDKNGDGVIEYDEFANALGSHMRSEEFHDEDGHHIARAHQ